ncbi:unnamed protein product [Brassicogethes aeneus]|uniref:Beta-1,4-mannosyl-glycoprotein 4-beta-N-acetylglucosaminyltransferase n=1 Tax=Brassicogethes aeneus TaxID=1431903 RepID=A0A9P0FMY9_BRAAE|nr:unnamed protein product [Brassicogethes aeneus]
MYPRPNCRKLFLGLLIVAQIILVGTFLYIQIKEAEERSESVTFLKNVDIVEQHSVTYHTVNSKINLRSIGGRYSFIDFNSSVCFKNGTDLLSMNRTKNLQWQCNCLPGWHGIDCGQPEVFWRAMLANRKPVQIKGPRVFERRIIYVFKVDTFSESVADIRVNELSDIVDLFILYENEGDNFLMNKLNNNFLKEFHSKILYVNSNLSKVWKKVKSILKNLRSEDLLVTSNNSEIINKNALSFAKFYDNWPQPLRFRLRWSVFGFFWIHPGKTIITAGACTVSYLKQNLQDRLDFLIDNRTLSNSVYKGIILGDLNHFGGWYCEFCTEATKIVENIKKNNELIDWNKVKNIDNNFVEDLIENGIYVDSKTELIRGHRYSDNYFAPKFVTDYGWKYDYLVINFYSKLDYYEG